MDIAAGHGMSGTDQFSGRRAQGTKRWKRAVKDSVKKPNNGRFHHCRSSFHDRENPRELLETRKRKRRTWKGGLPLIMAYRRMFAPAKYPTNSPATTIWETSSNFTVTPKILPISLKTKKPKNITKGYAEITESAAGDGDLNGELSVAQGGEEGRQASDDVGNEDSRAGGFASNGAGGHENSDTKHSSDAESDQIVPRQFPLHVRTRPESHLVELLVGRPCRQRSLLQLFWRL
nr:Os01g0209901 [Ipomoea batatas]